MIHASFYMYDNKMRPLEFFKSEVNRERRLVPKKIRSKIVMMRIRENQELRRMEDRVILEERSSPRLFGQRDSTQAHNAKSIEKHLRGERTQKYD